MTYQSESEWLRGQQDQEYRAMQRQHHQPTQQAALCGSDGEWCCPNCGSTTGQPVSWDFGLDAETGYHDAGDGCTECTK